MKEGYVYRWTDSSNGKKYIGSHCGNNKNYIGSGKLFKPAYKKRPECFTREILYTGPDYKELEEFILETIDAKNDDMYYNLSNSSINPVKFGEENGFYGKKHTEETKEIIRQSRLKNQHKYGKHTEESIEKIRQSTVGEKNHFYGKKHTKESRLKMSQNTKSIPVKELSTGLRFDSIKKCATYFNLDNSTIWEHLKNNRPISRGNNKGKHFVYEKQDN